MRNNPKTTALTALCAVAAVLAAALTFLTAKPINTPAHASVSIDPRAEAEAAWPKYKPLSDEQVELWDQTIGAELRLARGPEIEPGPGQYSRPRVVLQDATDQLPEIPAPPKQGETSTLADSMYSRWAIQYDIAQHVDAIYEVIRTEGITLTVAPSEKEIELLTSIEAQLKQLNEKNTAPSGEQWAAMMVKLTSIEAKLETAGGGLSDEDVAAIREAINGVAGSVKQLGTELEAVLGDGVAPPTE